MPTLKPALRALCCGAALALALLFGAQAACAATYFVDPAAGSDSADGLTPASAWRNVPGTEGVSGSGWAVLQPSDTVKVKRGSTFRRRLLVTSAWYSTRASAGQPITIEAAPGWGSGPVTWDGSGTSGSLVEIRAINGLRLDGMAPNGIVLTNSAQHGIEATGYSPSEKTQGLRLRYLAISRTAARGIQLWRQDDFTLVSVNVDGSWQANGASGICIGESGDNGCTNGRLDYCTAYHWGPQGAHQGAGTASYQGFWIVNCADITLNYCDGYENAGRGFDIGGVAGSTPVPLSDMIVLNCCRAFRNGNDGFGSSAEDMPESYQSRHYFNCCLAYQNASGGWQIYEGPTTCLYNCVSDRNGTALRMWGVNPGMGFQEGRMSHIRVYNCILSRPQATDGENVNGTVMIGYVNKLDLKMDYNFYVQGASDKAAVWGYYAPGPSIFYGYNKDEAPGGRSKWFQDTGCDEHSLCSIDGYRPDFVDPDRGDFHLQGSSDAIDAGCAEGPKFDFDGKAVPQGAAKDIGAFEFGAAGGVRPSAPRGLRAVAE